MSASVCVYGVPERAQSTQKRLRLCGAVLEGVGVSMSGSEVADQSKQQTDMLLGQCRVRAASKQEEEETRWGPARSSVQQSKRTFSPFLPRPAQSSSQVEVEKSTSRGWRKTERARQTLIWQAWAQTVLASWYSQLVIRYTDHQFVSNCSSRTSLPLSRSLSPPLPSFPLPLPSLPLPCLAPCSLLDVPPGPKRRKNIDLPSQMGRHQKSRTDGHTHTHSQGERDGYEMNE